MAPVSFTTGAAHGYEDECNQCWGAANSSWATVIYPRQLEERRKQRAAAKAQRTARERGEIVSTAVVEATAPEDYADERILEELCKLAARFPEADENLIKRVNRVARHWRSESWRYRGEKSGGSRKKKEPRIVPLGVRTQVLERDKFRCRRCGSGPDTDKLVIDHIVPYSKKGKTKLENLQTLCEPCNIGKRDRDPTPHDMEITT